MGEMSWAYSFRNQDGIESGPQALFVFNDSNCLVTPEMEILIGLIAGLGLSPTAGIFARFSSVKTEENCLLRISDLV